METRKLPKWAMNVLGKDVAESEVKEGQVLSNGIFFKSAIGRTDKEYILVEKRTLAPPKYTRFPISEAKEGGAIVQCPSCSSSVRLMQGVLPREIYCISCGSHLAVGENLLVTFVQPIPAPSQPKTPERIVPEPSGPFEYKGYVLHTKSVALKGGRQQRIYFFSKHAPHSGTPCAMPEGYVVGVNNRTGLPYLKKASGATALAKIPSAPAAFCEKRDDLTLIHGIGPEYEKRLNAAGITKYEDLLKYEPDELSRIASPDNSFGNRAGRQRWKAQAKRFATEKKYAGR
ncbi:MAG: hypothetical protein PHH26_03540 [Candidatus Thermoplasmatota archaeon]|nr:hypothetical protein [Candidatus Thermoplasmatota archaeon]